MPPQSALQKQDPSASEAKNDGDQAQGRRQYNQRQQGKSEIEYTLQHLSLHSHCVRTIAAATRAGLFSTVDSASRKSIAL